MAKSMIGVWLEQGHEYNRYVMCPSCKNVFRLSMLDREYTDDKHTELKYLRCLRCDWQDEQKWLFVTVKFCEA